MMRWRSRKGSGGIDPQGRRLLGLTLEGGEPIFAPKGHSLCLAANGAGKTTRGCMPWLLSLLSSTSRRAILCLDSKNGEMCIQAAPMLIEMGRKVAVIDDTGVWPQLVDQRVSPNPFGAIVSAFERDPRDSGLVSETMMQALIEDPPGGPDKNFHFRQVPREFDDFAVHVLLARNPDYATPGGAAAILNDPDMFRSFAEIEAEEGGPAVQSMARNVIEMARHENFGQHLSEARRSLRLFAPGTRLHEVGSNSTLTHEDLIREGYVIFLVGPQANITQLGSYYALHILAFTQALYNGAGTLDIIGDEITNSPVKPLISQITTLRAFKGTLHSVAQSRSEFLRKFGEHETRTLEENSIVKQWLGFSSFEEAERVSKAMGEQHAVTTAIGGDSSGLKTNINLSLTKQRHMTPAELMAMPKEQCLVHIKGVGFFLCRTIAQNQIAPYCHLVGDNPLEGGRLPPDPKITLVTPGGAL